MRGERISVPAGPCSFLPVDDAADGGGTPPCMGGNPSAGPPGTVTPASCNPCGCGNLLCARRANFSRRQQVAPPATAPRASDAWALALASQVVAAGAREAAPIGQGCAGSQSSSSSRRQDHCAPTTRSANLEKGAG